MRADPPRPCVLTIAGSDSGGGAGIQADLKTFAAYGVHGVSAIAALTAQNTRGVQAIHVPPAPFLQAQLESIFGDFQVAAVKLGMLANAAVIDALADALERRAPVQLVIDPVMVASSGAHLLERDALAALRARLLPLATLLTPNIPEAELLLGEPIATAAAADAALEELLALGPRAVLLKGGHMPGGGALVDRFGQGQQRHEFWHERLPLQGHGTGCTLAAAAAAALAHGASLLAACQDATDYVHGALRGAYLQGRGELALLDHLWRLRG
jgi:hydroxymethylpyrimidine/phosphomethylpyrimidine kinase